jgi:methyl-accepting chemotaxis protein
MSSSPQSAQPKIFDRLTLAAKFAISLAIVLAIFVTLASMMVRLQTARVGQELSQQLALEVSQHLTEERQREAFTAIDGIIQPTMTGAATRVTIVMIIASIGVVLVVYLLFIKLVRQRLKVLERRFMDVCDGDGDLRQRIEVHGIDGIDRLGGHFNRFLQKVHGIMIEVSRSTEELALRTVHVNEINRAVADGIMQQQSDTDRVATAMNQMTASVQEVTQNVGAAATAAQNAESEARSGKEIVGRNVVSIRDLADEVNRANGVIQGLRADSEQIGSVLEVIRGIAGQTNLLALNAAIEAARAGEQGRGFAVVADEVRTLAGRTQQATEEIQKMIEQLQGAAINAVEAMDEGSERASVCVGNSSAAGDALSRITTAVSSINDMNQQIATAARQQQSVTEEVDVSIVRINQASHTSVEKAQDAMSESQELVRLTDKLKGAVNQFKV